MEFLKASIPVLALVLICAVSVKVYGFSKKAAMISIPVALLASTLLIFKIGFIDGYFTILHVLAFALPLYLLSYAVTTPLFNNR